MAAKEKNTADEEQTPELELERCFPVTDSGFSFKKNFKRINKKMTSTVALRLKTNVTKALLKENACDDRKLQFRVDLLTRNQHRSEDMINNQKMIFEFQQQKRRDLWQKEDSFSVNRFNLPHISGSDRKLLSASLQQVYHAPQHEQHRLAVPLVPVMKIDSEPKIIKYGDQTYLNKESTLMELSQQQMNRYNRYRGAHHLTHRSVMDERFQNLSELLCETHLNPRERTRRSSSSYFSRALSSVSDDSHPSPDTAKHNKHMDTHSKPILKRSVTAL